MKEFGFGSLGLEKVDFLFQDKVVQLGYPPVRVDIITSVSVISWEEVVDRAIEGLYGDTTVRYIGLDQLIKNKKAIGRRKDLADLEALGQE